MLVCCLAAAAPAAADPVLTVDARGNAVTGGLEFAPAASAVAVGEDVAWINRDFFAPHTVVEEHRLWALGGSYGATPVNPAGFAPATTVERTFEAGTHKYFCTVHPEQMRGTVAVPVVLSKARRRVQRSGSRRDRRSGRTRAISDVTVRWSADPAEGQAFDAQRRTPGGQWVSIVKVTDLATGRFRTRPGTTWEVRARLRAAEGDATTEWSPVARITG